MQSGAPLQSNYSQEGLFRSPSLQRRIDEENESLKKMNKSGETFKKVLFLDNKNFTSETRKPLEPPRITRSFKESKKVSREVKAPATPRSSPILGIRNKSAANDLQGWTHLFHKRVKMIEGLHKPFLEAKEQMQELSKINLTYLEESAAVNKTFHANAVANMLFIYRHVIVNNRIFSFDFSPSARLVNFLATQLHDNVNYFTVNQLFYVALGIKELPQTPELEADIDRLYENVFQKCESQNNLFNIARSFSYLGSNKVLELLEFVNFNEHPKENILEILSNLQFLPPGQFPDRKFINFLGQIKYLELTDSEFTKAFHAITVCRYRDDDWDDRAKQMLQQTSSNVDKFMISRIFELQAKIRISC